jgi:hypothetical protein
MSKHNPVLRSESVLPSPLVQALAAVTLKMVEAIREVFPVVGRPWTKAGEDAAEATRPLALLLPRFTKCWWVPSSRTGVVYELIQPGPNDPPEVAEIIDGWLAVRDHYGWGKTFVYPNGELDRRKVQWEWPGVPDIDGTLLDTLESAARRLVPISSNATPTPVRAKVPRQNGKTKKPRWDARKRELWFAGKIVKRYTRRAPQQEKIYAVFQDDGWPDRVDDPLAPGRLSETLKHMKDSLGKDSPIRFGGDGTGEGIIWEPVNL